jgi:superfamily II DNA or RNA helicase
MLDGIEEVLMKKKVGHIRIDGGTPQSARQALVTRFQETDSVRAAVVCGCQSLCQIDYNSFIFGKWCLIFQH